MIHNHDRSHWFGASDTYYIMSSNTDTNNFVRWWLIKLGLIKDNFTNTAMIAGSMYEHRILDAFGISKRDRQIKKRKLRLRVNLDGETKTEVIEVKTHKSDTPFKISKKYWMQCQVEMFVTGKSCKILSYALDSDDYENFYNPIDKSRAKFHEIVYDPAWIKNCYLPRLEYFVRCLKEGRKPNESNN